MFLVATGCGSKVMEVKLVPVVIVINLSSHKDVSYIWATLENSKRKVIL